MMIMGDEGTIIFLFTLFLLEKPFHLHVSRLVVVFFYFFIAFLRLDQELHKTDEVLYQFLQVVPNITLV